MISAEEISDIRERLARLETNGSNRDTRLSRIEGKLDKLIESAHVGRGAWLTIVRAGAVLVAVSGAVAWAVDHWQKKP